MLSSIILAEFADHPYLHIPEDLMKALISNNEVPYINGCGASTGIMAGVSPSILFGTCVSAACYIHDWRYYSGETLEDKIRADMEFLRNMMLIIENDPSSLKVGTEDLSLRYNEAFMMFKFVHVYGFKDYTTGKNISSPERSYLDDLSHTIYITYKTCMIPFDVLGNAILSKIRSKFSAYKI